MESNQNKKVGGKSPIKVSEYIRNCILSAMDLAEKLLGLQISFSEIYASVMHCY